jgi:hypothetical protein
LGGGAYTPNYDHQKPLGTPLKYKRKIEVVDEVRKEQKE